MTKNNSCRPVGPKKWLTIISLNNDKLKSKKLYPHLEFQMVSILWLDWYTGKNALACMLECRVIPFHPLVPRVDVEELTVFPLPTLMFSWWWKAAASPFVHMFQQIKQRSTHA